jgi:molybdopterin-binding protein
MQISARNQLKGRVTDVKKGPASTEVTIDINGQIVVSSITTGSAETLNLEIGDDVTAVIKASNVMIAK